ncbi:MAG: methyl-accepting chemotaxis protein [Kineothrix sp.]
MREVKVDLSDVRAAGESRNLTVISASCILYAVLTAAYLLQVFKGERSVSYFLIVVLCCALPCIFSLAAYRRKKDSVAVRYIIGGGFALFYTYIIFTAVTRVTFCYIVVVYIILAVYVDKWLSMGLGVYAVAVNGAEMVYRLSKAGMSAEDVMEMEIVFACLVFAVIFTFMAHTKISRINQANIERAEREKKQSEELLAMMLGVADRLCEDVSSVTERTENLKNSIGITQGIMEEFSKGTGEAAEAISIQKNNTEEINRQIGEVGGVTDAMLSNINITEEKLEEEKQAIRHLLRQVENSEAAGRRVAVEMESLMDYAGKMQGILGMITSVANQTAMLALNASIEAARAGEAGRGFAVVASEISSLAGQTRKATGDINDLIGSVTTAVAEAAESIERLLGSNELQSEFISQTAGNFDQIEKEVGEIFDQIGHLKRMVDVVAAANSTVSENIDNVFAITEEVTAGANETLEGGRHDLESIEGIVGIMQDISKKTEELRGKRAH